SGAAIAVLCSSVRAVACASGIAKHGNHLRICNAPVLARGDQSLVPDVFGCGGINGVLGDVRGVIAHAFEATANKYQIQVTSQLLRVLRHALDSLMDGKSVQFMHPFIARTTYAT